MKGLKGRVALVTGATGLLGSVIAARLSGEGAVVGATSRDLQKAVRWSEGKEVGSRYVPLRLDLADPESIRSLVKDMANEPGVPTVLVANASLREGLAVPLGEMTHKSFTQLLEADTAGHFLLAREIVERLPSGASSSIVFLSSVYGLVAADPKLYPRGSPMPLQYGAAKAAALSVTRWLAAIWGARGVRVNAVVAGGVRCRERQTEEFVKKYSAKTMLGRMAEAEEVANAVAFLASDEASYITGQCLVVDGGFSAL